METNQKNPGLNIPAQTLKSSTKLEMNKDAVTVWRNKLPMADTGRTANEVYYALSDCNKVILSPKDRFQILELFRTPVQFVSQSIRKHYLNQTEALDEKKLLIVKFAQTLLAEMANGYKIIITELMKNEGSEDYKSLMTVSITRVLHYFSYILLRCYHLYNVAPKTLWQEFYFLYQYAESKNLLSNEELNNTFKHILIVFATDPYKWRQTEQDAIYNASLLWATKTTIYSGGKNDKPGLYLFEINQDEHPIPPIEAQIKDPKSCRILDLNKLVEHLKSLVSMVEPNELKARIEHANDPEYAISLPVLQGIIKEWETIPKREHERTQKTATIKVILGLSSIHYYLSGEKAFQSQTQTESQELGVGGLLPTINIQEEVKESTSNHIEMTPSTTQKAYQIYQAIEFDESVQGFCIKWENNAYPAIQAGEIIGLSFAADNTAQQWIIGMIRWLKHTNTNELKLGIRKLSDKGEAAQIQILKEGVGAGYYLRCLKLESGLLTPTLPFKTGNSVLVKCHNKEPEEMELLKLRSATGSYKLFDYKSKEKPSSDAIQTPTKVEEKVAEPETKDHKNPFDSIWSDL